MDGPFGDRPARQVASPGDGAAIAVFSATPPAPRTGAPLLLVHGTGSDHTTWRVLAPLLLAAGREVHALDRRGRGASGDGPGPYSAELEVADLAAVADALATAADRAVTIVGHSLGGRLALAAAAWTASIGAVVAYEGAPVALDADAETVREATLARLTADLARGDHDAVLERFMREVAELTEPELAAFRAGPLWAVRAATAPQIVRELAAARRDPAIGLEACAAAGVPVLQLAGSASPAPFQDGVLGLHDHLANGRVLLVDGARHNGHHTHAAAVAAAVLEFTAA